QRARPQRPPALRHRHPLRQMTTDPHNLQRFVDAQAPIYNRVLAELRSGQKQSHWMWFIFPQIQGLGRSPTAQTFAISSRQEAEPYAVHPTLAARPRECTQLDNAVKNRTVSKTFGSPDAPKSPPCMPLFAQAASDRQAFLDPLTNFFAGKPDQQPLNRL